VRIRTLYRCLLSLPLLVPGLLLPLALLHIAPPWLETFIGICGLSIVIGGIPYAFLAFSLLLWMRRKPERQIRMAMFIAPVLMVVLLGLTIVGIGALEGSPFDFNILTAWGVYSGYALTLGYFYVALACCVVWLARRTGWVADERDTPFPNDRMHATTGGLGDSFSSDGRAPAAPDAER